MKARAFKTKKTKTYLAVRKNKGESLYRNARKRIDKKFNRK
jgi:hypothetical protein